MFALNIFHKFKLVYLINNYNKKLQTGRAMVAIAKIPKGVEIVQ